MPRPVVLPLHPRTRARLRGGRAARRARRRESLAPPLGYLEFTALLLHARAVLTDSGGVQKEAYLAGVPCVTLRDTPSGARPWRRAGTCSSTSTPPRPAPRWSAAPPAERPPLYGDGRAGERVVEALLRRAGYRPAQPRGRPPTSRPAPVQIICSRPGPTPISATGTPTKSAMNAR